MAEWTLLSSPPVLPFFSPPQGGEPHHPAAQQDGSAGVLEAAGHRGAGGRLQRPSERRHHRRGVLVSPQPELQGAEASHLQEEPAFGGESKTVNNLRCEGKKNQIKSANNIREDKSEPV